MGLKGLVELIVDLRRGIGRVQLKRQEERLARLGEQAGSLELLEINLRPLGKCLPRLAEQGGSLQLHAPGIQRRRTATPDSRSPAVRFRHGMRFPEDALPAASTEGLFRRPNPAA